MKVSGTPDLINIICIRLEIIEMGFKECQTLLKSIESIQNPRLLDLINDARNVISTTRIKLHCRNYLKDSETEPNEGKFSPEEQLKGKLLSMSYFSSIVVPKHSVGYENISEEVLEAAQKASKQLQSISKEIKTILNI